MLEVANGGVMITGLEKVLLLRVAPALARFLFRRYLQDATGELGADLTDIGSEKISDLFERKQHSEKFEEMASAIVRNLVSVFPDFGDANAEAVLFEVQASIDRASLTDLVIEENLSASSIEKALLRQRQPDPGLTSNEVELFKRVIAELSRYVAQIASQLPHYSEALAKTTLGRLSQIAASIDEISSQIGAIASRIPDRGSEFASYELSYRLSLASSLDRVELIGVTIPIQLQTQTLTTSFVKLFLTSATTSNSISARRLLDRVAHEKRRLLTRGEAGAGKSTLSKWIAIQAALKRDAAVDRAEDVLFHISESSINKSAERNDPQYANQPANAVSRFKVQRSIDKIDSIL